ncbi:MAG: carbohydrate-binding domain-containing protein [Lachnospiraceae bacterium]|nr:carbohydrate-binding domain-containing protein [Lachnospiraceae bacterium]
MKQNLKKFFALAVLCLFAVALLAIPVSAASSKTVATIGKKNFTSLEKAISAVNAGETIVLKTNVTCTSTITVNRSAKTAFTLDLNGKTLTFKKNACFYLKKGTVTITNGKIKNTDTKAIKVAKNGTLTINGGTYQGNIINQGTMTVKKGTIKRTSTDYTTTYLISNSGTMTIKGGTFSTTANLLENKGKLVLSGGKFSSEGFCIANSTKKGRLTIKGGTFSASSTCVDNSESASCTITDGTFTSDSGYIVNNMYSATMKISGGTFKNTNKSYGHALFCQGSGSVLTVTGGRFTSAFDSITCNTGAQVTVSGGTFTMTDNGILFKAWGGTIRITGGTFKGSNGYKYYEVNDSATSGDTVYKAKVTISSKAKVTARYNKFS